jgi:hypothetical protein
MLLPETKILPYLKDKVKGVVHIGAHTCEELPFYYKLGLKNQDILWIEANPKLVQQVKQQNQDLQIINAMLAEVDDEERSINLSGSPENGFQMNYINDTTQLQSYIYNKNDVTLGIGQTIDDVLVSNYLTGTPTQTETPKKIITQQGFEGNYVKFSLDNKYKYINPGTYTNGTTFSNFNLPDKVDGTYTLATTDDIPKNRSFGVVFDGGGAVLTTGLQADVIIPYTMTITSWTMIADVSGSIVIDIWKDSYANYPATQSGSITGSAKPTLSSVIKNQSSTLTGWTTTVNSGDIIRFNVDSVSTITKATLVIQGTQN